MKASSQAVLDELLALELDPGSETAHAAFLADAELRSSFPKLEALQALLDLEAAEELAAAGTDAAALLDADAALERGALAPRRRPGWLAVAGLVAAAGLAAVLLVPLFTQDPAGPTPPAMLGTGALTLDGLLPRGPGSDLAVFQIQAALPAGSAVELRIFAADAALLDAPLVERFTSVDASPGQPLRLTLAPGELARLPDRIRWSVTVRDPEGQLIGSSKDIRASR